mgnify:CR=1 FL=1
MSKLKLIILLHIIFILYSLTGVSNKLAANEQFFSFKFFMYYAVTILLLGIYAITWQQIIKYVPLTTAFANKAITVIWGIVWGIVFFHETITIKKLIGTLFVITGIIIYAKADGKEENG